MERIEHNLSYDQIKEKISDLEFLLSKLGDEKLAANESEDYEKEERLWAEYDDITSEIKQLETLLWYQRNNEFDR
jgi:hypothetical protein